MSDIISILPDAIANQIAAGEVVQRPASIVKELLENSIDAGATHIILRIKDGGSTLIQVIDNGKGMSVTDARLCWERHATSKIRNADDLFRLFTFGFRGEALASIASVAQVEMKTRRAEDTIGTHIVIEASEVKSQLPVQCQTGTTISVKNVFFNVPARRNFLKSVAVETRHIIDEFVRIAIANPHLHLEMYNNDNEVYHLQSDTQAGRLRELMGLRDADQLIYEEEIAPSATLKLFLGVPEAARKTRGDQYFYANGRFIKSPYFHHAVMTAYENIIAKEQFPAYCIFIQCDPAKIDVNVHPTKTEVKFEEEKYLYHFLHSLSKKALHQRLSLNVKNEEDTSIHEMLRKAEQNPTYEPFKIKNNPGYSPFPKGGYSSDRKFSGKWVEIMQPESNQETNDLFRNTEKDFVSQQENDEAGVPVEILSVQQWQGRYLLFTTAKGIYLTERQHAHERVLFEKFYNNISGKQFPSQQLLFPRSVELSPQEMIMITELQQDLAKIGFDVSPFGKDTVVVNGLPASLQNGDVKTILKTAIAEHRETQQKLRCSSHEALARVMARQYAIRPGAELTDQETLQLCRDLLACEEPSFTPSGKPVFITFAAADLERKFQ